jgi:hypothetical protein
LPCFTASKTLKIPANTDEKEINEKWVTTHHALLKPLRKQNNENILNQKFQTRAPKNIRRIPKISINLDGAQKCIQKDLGSSVSTKGPPPAIIAPNGRYRSPIKEAWGPNGPPIV